MKYLAKFIHFMQNSQALHRDLTPQNIMLTRKMVPKIIDYGSAYIRAESEFRSEISETRTHLTII